MGFIFTIKENLRVFFSFVQIFYFNTICESKYYIGL